ncbi:MAG: carbohydrate porin [Rhizobiaceae bacterium]
MHFVRVVIFCAAFLFLSHSLGHSQEWEGSESVVNEIEQDEIKLGTVLPFSFLDDALSGWIARKEELHQATGLKLNMSYQSLYQHASPSPGESDAASGRAEWQGNWTLIGRNTPNDGSLSFRLENRHLLGTDVAPSALGDEFGSILSTGNGFSSFGWAITELAWRQNLMDGDVYISAGKISATNWYNSHALSSKKEGFQNVAIQQSSTGPLPGRGLGIVSGLSFNDNLILVAGMHDANASTSGNPFDTISQSEFYHSAELRWLPNGWEMQKFDQVRLQVWRQDARKQAGIPAGHGVTFLASHQFDEMWLPFIMGGISDGNASDLRAELTAGLGINLDNLSGKAARVVGIGASWGNPSDSSLQDQYTFEAFSKIHLADRFHITPSVQFIINPASDPRKQVVTVIGFRARFNM